MSGRKEATSQRVIRSSSTNPETPREKASGQDHRSLPGWNLQPVQHVSSGHGSPMEAVPHFPEVSLGADRENRPGEEAQEQQPDFACTTAREMAGHDQRR